MRILTWECNACDAPYPCIYIEPRDQASRNPPACPRPTGVEPEWNTAADKEDTP